MFITVGSITNYNEKCTMDTWSKQTQSNPTCSELACTEHSRRVESILLYVEAVWQFLQRTAGTSGIGPAEFFADLYQQCVVFVE